jgi:signal transduction histidine kinase
MFRHSRLVYGLLLAAWILILAWQVAEHRRVRASERAALILRSRDITTTLGLVIRSQRRFGGMVSQGPLESALTELVRPGELTSIALLNATGEVMVSAGPPIDLATKGMLQTGTQWEPHTVTIVNLVDLGSNLSSEDSERPTVVMPRRDGGGGPRDDDRDRPGRPVFGPPPPDFDDTPSDASTNATATNIVSSERSGLRRDGFNRPRPGRPFWMDEKEFQSLLQRRGVHGLVLALPTDAYRRACTYDLWMRWIISILASVAVGGLALAWRNLARSSNLELRLVRAAELNTRLKEMNLAAAGLAHETRNPLNIIRGLAHLISRQPESSDEIRGRSREIVTETDRVTAQLNEFINYSRPREVRRTAVSLGSVVTEVVRALSYDIEEKHVRLDVEKSQVTIEADEQLLRQALFNLLLNAIQAVGQNGDIQVVANRLGPLEAFLEVRDDGPGVPEEHRTEIFKPYFTTQPNGTGLGLAVVQQIVLAHGWEIECLPNSPKGAVFRISHLRATT